MADHQITAYSQQYLAQMNRDYDAALQTDSQAAAHYQLVVQSVALCALNVLDATRQLCKPLIALSPLMALQLNRYGKFAASIAGSMLLVSPGKSSVSPVLKTYAITVYETPRAMSKVITHIALTIFSVPLAGFLGRDRLVHVYRTMGLFTDEPQKEARRLEPDNSGFKEVIGLDAAKEQLQKQVLLPAKWAGKTEHKALEQLKSQRGILFYGPPGCGKTHLAHALAAELGAVLQDIRIATVGSKYINETSTNIREAFDQARDRGGRTVLLLDEADSLLCFRSDEENRQHASEVTNTLLQEMDKICKEKGSEVWIVACTNNPSKLDAAAVRNGRINVKIHVEAPDLGERKAQLKHFTAELTGLTDEDIDQLAAATERCTVTDLETLVDKVVSEATAGLLEKLETGTAKREELDAKLQVSMEMFTEALKSLHRSVREDVAKFFKADARYFSGKN